MARNLTQEERQKLREKIAYSKLTSSKIAIACDCNRGAVIRERYRLLDAGFKALSAEAEKPQRPEEKRQEIRDAAFWRNQATQLQRKLSETEHVMRELGGIRDVPITPPDWMVTRSNSKPGKAILMGILSDLHVGEVIDSDETQNINAYDPDIFKTRIRRYFSACSEIGPRWSSDCDLKGFLLVLGGDMISGDIHEELLRTNALTSNEQVRLAAAEIIAGARHLVDTFGRVHVVSVPGNHGRQTQKPTAKQYSRLSYDTLCADMVRDALAHDSRFSWQISPGSDATVPVFGRRVLVTHGDKIGTRGGQGFAGPILPQARGGRLVTIQAMNAGRPFDLLVSGHYHTSSNPGAALWNGSVPGYSEYANGLRASVEPPQQWLALLHEKWWLRERAEIKLDQIGAMQRVVEPFE